jgi:alanine dehydrogenase
MRTAGISGVASRCLAKANADDMAIIGTGKQALAQVAGVNAVRALKRLRVYSPTLANRQAFAEKLQQKFSMEVIVTGSVEAAVKDASIVTLVTRAQEPFLDATMLAPGCHINAVGAITPERQEFSQDIFGRARLVVVDSVDSVRRLSSEFIQQFGDDEDKWSTVKPLSSLVADNGERPADADLTLFKAMGMGLSDLAMGTEILQRAKAKGAGRKIPQPEKQALRIE